MIAVLLLCASVIMPEETTKRDSSVAYQFKKAYGILRVGEGQVDHCTALRCQGKDEISNLQFLCGPSLKLKEKLERDCTIHFRCRSREENIAAMKTCPGTVLKK